MPSSITELENDGGEAESLLKRESFILSRPPSLTGPRHVGLPCTLTQAVAEGDKSTSSPPNFEFSGPEML